MGRPGFKRTTVAEEQYRTQIGPCDTAAPPDVRHGSALPYIAPLKSGYALGAGSALYPSSRWEVIPRINNSKMDLLD